MMSKMTMTTKAKKMKRSLQTKMMNTRTAPMRRMTKNMGKTRNLSMERTLAGDGEAETDDLDTEDRSNVVDEGGEGLSGT